MNKPINPQIRTLRPGEQVPVTPEMMKSATPKVCSACGCECFMQAVTVCTISALVSPVGQELAIPKAVLVCLECKKVLE